MYQRVVFCLFMLTGLTVNSQTINLHGTVSNSAGKPVPNAIVSLVGQGLKDTTGADGIYAFSQGTAVELPFLPSETEKISLNRGVLEFTVPHPSVVKVELFNAKGILLKKEYSKDVLAGVYRLNIAKNFRATNLLVIHASIGNREMTFTYLPVKDGKHTVNSSIESSIPIGGKLAKVEAVNDSLKTTAPGYASKTMAITSYDQLFNITLDSSGVAGRSSGCGKTPTLKSGKQTISTGGQNRDFILSLPSNYDNTHPYRLIFAFHWRGGKMEDVDGGGTSGAAWSYYGLKERADNSTIFVAPQGLGGGWGNSGGQDVTFVDDMLKLIKSNFCIDTTRIFAMGFSWGGGMSYALACGRPTVFRAVAVYSGMELSGCVGGTLPVAYIGLHGISDGTNNIAAGRSLRDKYVKNNGCTAQSPPEPSKGSGKHIVTAYSGCKPGYPVLWAAFDGDHTPGNVDGGGDDGAKTWTKVEVWKFFTQF